MSSASDDLSTDARLEFGRTQIRTILTELTALEPPVPPDLDERLERRFRDALESRFSGDPVIGEELPAHEEWNGRGWLVDPIDGSTNLQFGLPWFCTSLCYVEAGRPMLGWVADPSRHEIYEAIRGGGATVDGIPLDVANAPPSPLVCVGQRFRRRHPEWREKLPRGLKERGLGATALELAWIARGILGGGAWAHARVFDIAAGWLLLDEAGAFRLVTPGQGSDLGDPDLASQRREFVAGHPAHREWLERLIGDEESSAPE